MAKKFALRDGDLKKVSGGRRKHTHHIETRSFLNMLFNRKQSDAILRCENPKHRQKQG